MSLPRRYVHHSNPTTPRVYDWDIQPQDPQVVPSQGLQLFPINEDQPAQLQQQPQTQHQHQLSPIEVNQQQQEQEQEPRQQAYEPPRTIQLQERAAKPGYFRFDNMTEQDFLNASASGENVPESSTTSRRRSPNKSPLRVDTSLLGSSPGALSAGTSVAGTSSSMPMRASRTHVQSAHPYRRPASAAPRTTAVRTRQESEQEQTTRGPATGTIVTCPLPPMVGTFTPASCPAASSWRDGVQRSTGNVRYVAVASLSYDVRYPHIDVRNT